MRRFAVLAALLLTRCVYPVVEAYDPKTYTEGLIFPRVVPVAQVDAGCGVTMVPIPDYTHQSVLTKRGWFGDLAVAAGMTDGWKLTQLNYGSVPDSTLTTLTNAAAQAKGMMGGALFPAAGSAGGACKPGLYEIDLEDHKLRGPFEVPR